MDINTLNRLALSALTYDKPAAIPDWLASMPYSDEPYYRFLYEVAKAHKPKRILELGSNVGQSASFMALGAPDADVTCVDLNPDSYRRLNEIALNPNSKLKLYAILGSTLDPAVISLVAKDGPYDMLYIDTVHTYYQAAGELYTYWPMLAMGAVICHDDLTVHPEMPLYWNHYVPEPKVQFPFLHHTGFGVSIKSFPTLGPPPDLKTL